VSTRLLAQRSDRESCAEDGTVTVPDTSAGPRPLLEIRDLTLTLRKREEDTVLVRDVSLDIAPGEVTGLVGETGAGKSLTAWSVIGLLPPAIHRTGGSIRLAGTDLAACSEEELRKVRGAEISMIVQNPKSALLPTRTVGDQLALVHRAHNPSTRKQARAAAVEAIASVGLGDARRRAEDYPHQLSGGQAQRVVVAMALMSNPRLVIADEPTTGLDVTVQAGILDLLMARVRERGAALWLITHDLGIIANYAQRTAVMFAGEIVEGAATDAVFSRPAHPYTRGLMAAADLGVAPESAGSQLMVSGPPPDLADRPSGCQFAYRCPFRADVCEAPIPLHSTGPEHQVRCVRAEEIGTREISHVS
jgi:oligopeptide/dipeptide ABC transporter ATP-binding protein